MTGYNYETFSSDEVDFHARGGPEIGAKAPDARVFDTTGEPCQLLDFEGDFLVLEIGSITCPLFQSRRKSMGGLRDVASVVLYVREAHPGADIAAHRTLDHKIASARCLVYEDGETRRVLVDDLDGTAHRAYGGLPNSVFIINRNGCVVFKSDWNDPTATAKALQALRGSRPIRAKSFFRPARPSVAIHTLGRAGKGSVRDFLRSFPNLVWKNLIKRNLRVLLGRPLDVAGDIIC
ncbi:hypothetical protein J7394_20875 [Ruegeria sp. R13_0]|uniref:deiodinase-like protein n=1 Tax=Ruegeria sp. R13_0 TaxID=2821099 RepID=UPI001ADBF4D2|nr:deiodinase-like protein [Ruegeria sp. R13_0]MBO9436671.1 hypothetical protein [Ruegeria sp. R13_0]